MADLIGPDDGLWRDLGDALAEQMGLHFPEARRADLQRGIAAAARVFGMADAEACARWLLSAPLTSRQVAVLANHLGVRETYFFRDHKVFEALRVRVLPALMRARASRGRRLRIWSAGCSTGEEPYSIAMLLAMMPGGLSSWNISILGTDIDAESLRKARRGVYSDWSFRDAPDGLKERFFSRTPEGRFAIAAEIRERVTFAFLNLAQDAYPSPLNGTEAVDLLLCRNVLMYFQPARARAILQKLGGALAPDGWLLISPAEIPHVAVPDLAPVTLPGAIFHRRRAAGRPDAGVASTAREVQLDQPQVRPAPPPRPTVLAAETRAAVADPDARTMAALARAHADEGRLEEAATWSGRVLQAEKLNADWWYLHATILLERGLDAEAEDVLRRSLYLAPDHALAHFALGNLAGRHGNRDDARRHFRNALSALERVEKDALLPESGGMTAGMLAALIRMAVDQEARA